MRAPGTFPSFHEFLVGLSRAAGIDATPDRPSGTVKPSELDADVRAWLDAEVEAMRAANALHAPAPEVKHLYRKRVKSLRPDQMEAVRMVERILDEDPNISIRRAAAKVHQATGLVASSVTIWRQVAISQGLIQPRPRRYTTVGHGPAITYSKKGGRAGRPPAP